MHIPADRVLKSILEVFLIFFLFSYLIPKLLDSFLQNLNLLIRGQFSRILQIEVGRYQLWTILLHGGPLAFMKKSVLSFFHVLCPRLLIFQFSLHEWTGARWKTIFLQGLLICNRRLASLFLNQFFKCSHFVPQSFHLKDLMLRKSQINNVAGRWSNSYVTICLIWRTDAFDLH